MSGSAKTLSTGTLSLRFMQNAHRAKQLVEVQAEKAQIKDDGEWEITEEVRKAWDIGPSDVQPAQPVTYETSYLPFLFPSLPESSQDTSSLATVPKLRGRRTFNKGGKEVVEQKEPELPASPQAPASPSHQPKQSKTPRSISGPSRRTKDSAQTAQNIIRDATGVGSDLRGPHSVSASDNLTSSPEVFLKPVGVDAPRERNGDVEKDVIQGARAKTRKRERVDSTVIDGGGKKRKKKRKSSE